MGGAQLALLIGSIGRFYGILIIVYVLMSWFPMRGFFYDAYRVLGSVVDPYLNLFRRFIPPVGGLDLSPIVAYFVLQFLIVNVLVQLAYRL